MLVLKGGDAQPRLKVRNAEGGVDTIQNAITNPDVVVEVRDDRIYAVRAGLHHDANEKPMTREQLRRLEEEMKEEELRKRQGR